MIPASQRVGYLIASAALGAIHRINPAATIVGYAALFGLAWRAWKMAAGE